MKAAAASGGAGGPGERGSRRADGLGAAAPDLAPGRSLRIRDMAPADLAACAAIVCDSEIGRRYGFDQQMMEGVLNKALSSSIAAVEGSTAPLLFVAESGGSVAGFAWVEPQGAFASAPYLRLIAVGPVARGGGVGAALLSEFEARTAWVGRDWCLLVSDFNLKAQAFYGRHGYLKAGTLPGFAKPGIDEVIMVKSRNQRSL